MAPLMQSIQVILDHKSWSGSSQRNATYDIEIFYSTDLDVLCLKV